MFTTTQQIENKAIAKARELGAKAFHEGRGVGPGFCSEFMELLATEARGLPLGCGSKLMRAFIDAWNESSETKTGETNVRESFHFQTAIAGSTEETPGEGEEAQSGVGTA